MGESGPQHEFSMDEWVAVLWGAAIGLGLWFAGFLLNYVDPSMAKLVHWPVTLVSVIGFDARYFCCLSPLIKMVGYALIGGVISVSGR